MRRAPFQKVNTSRVSEGVVAQIREAIIRGRLQPGDRLPAQREMAEIFGVGRSALLEALRVLEQAGLIVIRPGGTGGAFVAAPSIEQVSDSLGLLLQREGTTMEELAEFRIVLESYAFSLAVERATPEELAGIESQYRALRALREQANASWTEFVDRELALHLAVVQLCRNRVLTALLRAIETWEMSFSPLVPEAEEPRLLSDWDTIVRGLLARDKEQVQTAIRRHIADFGAMVASAAAA